VHGAQRVGRHAFLAQHVEDAFHLGLAADQPEIAERRAQQAAHRLEVVRCPRVTTTA
jgi:hypothetical protein